MPLRIGLIVYPLFAVAALGSRRGVVSTFARANAMTPGSARKPASLSIRDLDTVRSAARHGMLVATGDGRYYVNVPKYLRRQRWVTAGLVAAGVLILAVTVMMFWPDLA